MNDREQFEAWHAEKFGWLNAEIWPGNGSYDDRFVQDRWEVWSAARATPAQTLSDERIDKIAADFVHGKTATAGALRRFARAVEWEIGHVTGVTTPAQPVDKAIESLLNLIWRINDTVLKALPHHPDSGVMNERYCKSPINVFLNVESLVRYFEGAKKESAAKAQPSPSSVGAAIRKLPLPEPWEYGDGNHEDKFLESQFRDFRTAAAEIAAKAGPQWASVEGRLPEMDAPVWLYEQGRGVWIGGRADSGDGWLWCNAYGSQYSRADGTWSASSMEMDDDYQPSHWMPLPAAPVAQADGEEE